LLRLEAKAVNQHEKSGSHLNCLVTFNNHDHQMLCMTGTVLNPEMMKHEKEQLQLRSLSCKKDISQ